MSRLNSAFRKYSISCVLFLVLGCFASFAQTGPSLAPDLRSKIDGIAHQVLQTTGVPSASLAVVKDGKVGTCKPTAMHASIRALRRNRRCGTA
jgi:CubicO group peptidase (beta-lactamase class C family)